MKKSAIAIGLMMAAASASAATTIDVNFIVTQTMLDREGHEALQNEIIASLPKVSEYYKSQYTGITKDGKPEDLVFNFRQLVVVSDTYQDAGCASEFVNVSSSLHMAGLINFRDALPDGYEFGFDTSCMTQEDNDKVIMAARTSGADFWVTLHDGVMENGTANGLAAVPASVGVVMGAKGSYVPTATVAHEFLHLFGGVDLYNKPESAECNGGEWQGRLMCGNVAVNANLFGQTKYMDEKLFLQRFYSRTDTTVADWTYNSLFHGSAFKESGASLGTQPAVASRTASLSLSGTTLSADTPSITLSVVVAGAEGGVQPVAVEVYTLGGTAKAGENYLDNVVQTVTFDPANPDYTVDANNNWVKQVKLTSKSLDFTGTKSLQVGLRHGNATGITGAATTISVVGTKAVDNGGDNGGGGGGSTGPAAMVMLLGAALLRRWKR